jgi:hypothetical protein
MLREKVEGTSYFAREMLRFVNYCQRKLKAEGLPGIERES